MVGLDDQVIPIEFVRGNDQRVGLHSAGDVRLFRSQDWPYKFFRRLMLGIRSLWLGLPRIEPHPPRLEQTHAGRHRLHAHVQDQQRLSIIWAPIDPVIHIPRSLFNPLFSDTVDTVSFS